MAAAIQEEQKVALGDENCNLDDEKHSRIDEAVSTNGTEETGEETSQLSEESQDEQPKTVLRRVADALLVACGTVCGGCVSATHGCADATATACFPTDPPLPVQELAAIAAEDAEALPLLAEEPVAPIKTPEPSEPGRLEEASKELAAPVAVAVPAAAGTTVETRKCRLELKERRRHLANEKSGFLPGATLEVVSATVMRSGEDLASSMLGELKPGDSVVIEELGSGKRLKVKDLATNQVGWVSKRSATGDLELLAVKFLSPGEAYGPGALAVVGADPVIMRKDESMESEKICEIASDESLRVVDAPNGRRMKVERLATGEVGWVSATGKDRRRFLKLVEEQPWRSEGFITGAVIQSLRTVILRKEESTKSDIIRECNAGDECVVVTHGEGCRMFVRNKTLHMTGWVSTASAHGGFLFGIKKDGFMPGQQVVTASVARFRQGKDTSSESIAELDPGEKCTILEVAEDRRVKVQVAGSGQVGWVSCLTKQGEWLLKVTESATEAAPPLPPPTAPAPEQPPTDLATKAVPPPRLPAPATNKSPIEAPTEAAPSKAPTALTTEKAPIEAASKAVPAPPPPPTAPAAEKLPSEAPAVSRPPSIPPSVHEELIEEEYGEEEQQEALQQREPRARAALHLVASKVVPVCGAVLNGAAVVVGGAVLAVSSAVGAVVAAPFYGCYFGIVGCASCGSAIRRRLRPKMPAERGVADSEIEAEEAVHSEVVQGEMQSEVSSVEKPPSVAKSEVKVEDWERFMMVPGQIEAPGGCFCCMFTRISYKE